MNPFSSTTVMASITFVCMMRYSFYWRWWNPTTICFPSPSPLVALSDAAFTGNDKTCGRDVFHFFVVLSPEGAIYAVDGEMHNKRFHIYFGCMENAMQLWMCEMKWKTDTFSISFTFVLATENSVWTCGSLVCLSMMKELCNVLKAFRTWVASKSEGDIMKENVAFAESLFESRRQHVFGWERWCLKCFHVFQTLKHVLTNKPCHDVKISRFDMRFASFCERWHKDVNMRHSSAFCVKEVTRQHKETKQQVQRHLRLCAVKVAELWDRLTCFVWTVLFLKDDVLVADPGRSRGFEGWHLPHNKVCLGFVHVKIQQKEEEQSVANKKDG